MHQIATELGITDPETYIDTSIPQEIADLLDMEQSLYGFPQSNDRVASILKLFSILGLAALTMRDQQDDMKVAQSLKEVPVVQQIPRKGLKKIQISSHLFAEEMIAKFYKGYGNRQDDVIAVLGGSGNGKDNFIRELIKQDVTMKLTELSLGGYFRAMTEAVIQTILKDLVEEEVPFENQYLELSRRIDNQDALQKIIDRVLKNELVQMRLSDDQRKLEFYVTGEIIDHKLPPNDYVAKISALTQVAGIEVAKKGLAILKDLGRTAVIQGRTFTLSRIGGFKTYIEISNDFPWLNGLRRFRDVYRRIKSQNPNVDIFELISIVKLALFQEIFTYRAK